MSTEPKKKSKCRFAPTDECPHAKAYNEGWQMPTIDYCLPCRLQAILKKMEK